MICQQCARYADAVAYRRAHPRSRRRAGEHCGRGEAFCTCQHRVPDPAGRP